MGIARRTLVYLGLGTNVGRRADNLRRAITALSGLGDVVGLSDVYESDAVGYADQPRFWNMAVAAYTTLAPAELLDTVKRLERDLGRTPTFDQGPRVIDIDLLLYGSDRVKTPTLDVPHPRMLERPFVLRPLLDLEPELVDPVSGRPIAGYLEAAGRDASLVRVSSGAGILDPHTEGM